MESDKKITTELSSGNIDPVSFFDKDADFVFVYKKTEKLASAVYMVTNLFSEMEPMKWSLRKKVSDLLSSVLTYKDIPKANRLDFIYNVKTEVLEIISLLEISQRGGLISEMNFSILREEFYNLTAVFDSANSTEKDLFQSPISKTFFDVVKADTYLKDGSDLRTYQISHGLVTTQKIAQNMIKDTSSITDKGAFKRSDRQNTILSLLKKKKELTIKDIAEVIKDCSEKTIQRELISFIEAGVIKRTGERRWSRYSLNS